MSSNETDAFLLGGGVPSAFGEHDPVGHTVAGTISEPPTIRQQTDMKDGTPLTWSNGDPRMQLIVTLQTDLRGDADDDGRRRLYVKGSTDPGSKSLRAAIAGAVRSAGANGLAVGGRLTVRYVGEEPAKTRGFNPRKLWAAQYTPPTDAFLANEPAQPPVTQSTATDPWAAPPPVTTPAQPAAPSNADVIAAAARAAGVDPALLAAAMAQAANK